MYITPAQAKFYFFEKVVELFYKHVFTKPRIEYSKSTQLSVTFASGYIAGSLLCDAMCACLISQFRCRLRHCVAPCRLHGQPAGQGLQQGQEYVT